MHMRRSKTHERFNDQPASNFVITHDSSCYGTENNIGSSYRAFTRNKNTRSLPMNLGSGDRRGGGQLKRLIETKKNFIPDDSCRYLPGGQHINAKVHIMAMQSKQKLRALCDENQWISNATTEGGMWNK